MDVSPELKGNNNNNVSFLQETAREKAINAQQDLEEYRNFVAGKGLARKGEVYDCALRLKELGAFPKDQIPARIGNENSTLAGEEGTLLVPTGGSDPVVFVNWQQKLMMADRPGLSSSPGTIREATDEEYIKYAPAALRKIEQVARRLDSK